VLENVLPFAIKRIFYIFDVLGERGKHRHKKTQQALIVLGGSCSVYVNNGKTEENFILDKSNKCLIIEPEDWHTMDNFSKSATLLVLASEDYDVDDYIHEPY
jgi:quercetin dioxygenase-like cupin family protein